MGLTESVFMLGSFTSQIALHKLGIPGIRIKLLRFSVAPQLPKLSVHQTRLKADSSKREPGVGKVHGRLSEIRRRGQRLSEGMVQSIIRKRKFPALPTMIV